MKRPIPADERHEGMAVPIRKTCGDCRFFKGEARFKSPCQELGEVESNLCCPAFQQNVRLLNYSKDTREQVITVAKEIAMLPTSAIADIIVGLANEARTRRNGYHYGQVVWLQVCGNFKKAYVNNFARGYVVSADKTHVIIRGAGESSYTVMQGRPLTEDQWKKKKKKLISLKRLNDPKQPYKVKDEDAAPLVTANTDIDEAFIKAAPKGKKVKITSRFEVRDSKKMNRDPLDMGMEDEE